MRVLLNGEPHELPTGATVSELVADAAPGRSRGIAVAVDAEVVPRGDWDDTELHEGQQVELVAAIQGGA